MWVPNYHREKGSFSIAGVSLNECPVTAITFESNEFRESYLRQQVLKEAGVASIPQSSLPIRTAEAYLILRQAENRFQNKRMEHTQADLPE